MHKKFAFATSQLLLISAALTATPDQTISWNGFTSENWSDSTNWTSIPPGGIPIDGCDMTFPQSGVSRFISNNDEFVDPNSITIHPPNGGSYTLMGNPVTVSSSILVAGGDANSSVNVSLPLRGTAGLTKEGPGTLILSLGQDYSGDTLVRGGTLQAGADNPFSINSAVVLGDGLSSSAILDLNGHSSEIVSLADYAATPGTVLLGSGDLTLFGETPTIFYGSISGTGGLTLGFDALVTLTLANSHGVNYSGDTVFSDGILRAGADNAFSPHSRVFFQNEPSILDLNGFNNTIPSVTSETFKGVINLGSGTLTVGDATHSNYTGEINGTGGLVKQGSGTLLLSSIDKLQYSGGTTILAGTLQGDTNTLQGLIDNQATLHFTQVFNPLVSVIPPFDGTIIGNGRLIKDGFKTLIFSQQTSKVANFKGATFVNDGTLLLNTTLGGSGTTVIHTGVITGNGTVQGDLTASKGGTVAPGDGIGTLHVGGNYLQQANTIYQVRIDATGGSSFLDVAGTATLEGGEVLIKPTEGQNFLNKTYDILHADKGLTGTFAGIKTNVNDSILFGPVLSYTATDVLLTIQLTLVNAATTANERAVAEQLDSIVNANDDEALILSTLAGLWAYKVSEALDQMTGQQYLSELLTAEITNRQFLRRLYDPVRGLVTTIPCERDCCHQSCELDFWFEGGGSRSFLRGSRNEASFASSGFELAGGVQAAIASNLTVGVAAGYAVDQVHYRDCGAGTNHTYLGGIYGLYRPCDYYVMADALFGVSHNKAKRHINFGDIKRTVYSKPKIHETTFYLEAGKDFCCKYFLVQPFAGIELSYAQRDQISEHGADSLDLVVFEKKLFNAYGSLGVHLTQAVCDGLDLSMDLAWQYRFSERQNHLTERFRDFGTPFKIKGISEERNSFEGAVTISKEIVKGWTLYAEFAGQRWKKISSYNYLAGVEARW